jgi:hypothetical protein
MIADHQPPLDGIGRDADQRLYSLQRATRELTQIGPDRSVNGRLLLESSAATQALEGHSFLAGAFRDAEQRLHFQRDGVQIVVLVLPRDFDGSGAHQNAHQDPAQKRAATAVPPDWQNNVRSGIRKRWRMWAGLLIFSASFAAGIYPDDATFMPALDRVSHSAQLMLSLLPFASEAQLKSRLEMERSLEAAAGGEPNGGNRTTLSLPLPDSYGLYAVNGGQLTHLESMHIRIPDPRIAFAGLIIKPSSVTLPDGRLSFVAYQRDLATSAPDTASVRIIAQVARVLSFGTAGVPKITPLEDTWAMRAVSFDLKVAPVSENREMMQLRLADANFSLSPGRYMLVFNNQAYDFAVEGAVTDLAHCLERTETQNGSVYTQCRELPKPPELNATLRLSRSSP